MPRSPELTLLRLIIAACCLARKTLVLFGLSGVSTGLGSSRSSIGLPDGEKITVSWDAGMDSGISTTSFSVTCGSMGSDGPTSCVKRSICSWIVLPRAAVGSAVLCPGARLAWPGALVCRRRMVCCAFASCTSNWVMRWDEAGSAPCAAACTAAGVPMVCCAELLALPATCFLCIKSSM